MRLVVDSDVVVAASAHVAAHAGACRELAAELSAELSAIGGLADRDIGAGFIALTDVSADVLELVAIDLDLVAARMSAGARLYSAVDATVDAAVAGADPTRGP